MAGSRARTRQSFAGSAALAALAVLSTAVAEAQGGWVLVRPPLDVPRLEALGRDPAFLAASGDAKVAAVLPVALDVAAPLARWQRWVVYDSPAACEAGRRDSEANARQGLAELARFVPAPNPLAREAKEKVRIEGEVERLRFEHARCVPEAQAPR